MEACKYIEEMKIFQKKLIDYIDNEGNVEEEYENLIESFMKLNVQQNAHDLKRLLYLLHHILKNHHRNLLFFNKIEKIIIFFKNDILHNMSNDEIFNIFKCSHIIILFLIEEKIIKVNDDIIKTFLNDINQKQYFLPEILIHQKSEQNIEKEIKCDLKTFEQKRKIGENDNYICELIRNDSIDEFISFVNQNNIVLTSTIKSSIFETNAFLIKNKPTLIEYSAFFGSPQIFRYLFKNINYIYNSDSLLLYSIHGQNEEIFEMIKDIFIDAYDNIIKACIIESIKCHHLDVISFILNNFDNNGKKAFDDYHIIKKILKYSNFSLFPKLEMMDNYLYYLCKYNYFMIVKCLMKKQVIDINQSNSITNNNYF